MRAQAGLIAPSSTPDSAAGTEFKQAARQAGVVKSGTGIASIRNRSGLSEFFSVGAHGLVHNHYPDASSDSGYSSTCLEVQAGALGVLTDSQGGVVVLAAHGKTLHMVAEQPGHTTRWAQPVPVPLPWPVNASRIAAVFTTQAAGRAHIALLLEVPHAQASRGGYHLLLAVLCNAREPRFIATGLILDSLQCAWVGGAPCPLTLACADAELVSISPLTGQVARLPIEGDMRSQSVCSATDGIGQAHVYAVLGDGQAYRLAEGRGVCFWLALVQGLRFAQIAAQTDGSGTIHLLCVGVDGVLYHLQPQQGDAAGWVIPVPILADVTAAAMAANDDGQIEAFAAVGAPGGWRYLAWDEMTGSWEVHAVNLETETTADDLNHAPEHP